MQLNQRINLLNILGLSLLLTTACTPTPNYRPNAVKPTQYSSPETANSVVEPSDSEPGASPIKTPTPSAVEPLSVSVSLSAFPLVTSGSNSLWPRAVNLGDGKLVLVYGQDIEGFHTLKTQASTDDGLTWQDQGEVAREAVSATRELRDANLTLLPNGTLLAIYRNINDGIFRLQVSASTDEGRTWLPRGDVDVSSGAAAQNMLHPILKVSAKGKIQAYYSKAKTPNGELNIVMRTSSDEGKTWANELVVATRAVGNVSFPAVVGLQDGSIVVMFDTPRVDGDTHLIIRSTQSNNDGLTWSSPQDVYVPLNGQRSAKSPQASVMKDGRPLVFFMTDEDSVDLSCCSLKLVVASSVGTFQNLTWGDVAITAVAGSDNVFPSGVDTTSGDFLLFYEHSANVSFNRVKIEGGL